MATYGLDTYGLDTYGLDAYGLDAYGAINGNWRQPKATEGNRK